MISKAVYSIVKAVADRAATECVSSTVEWLRLQRSTLAGDDSGLGSLWLEFCAQVQGEHSIFWEEYESVVSQKVESLVRQLPAADRQALWLQTEAGNDWLDEEASVDVEHVPVFLEDVVNDLYSKVWQRAADWEEGRLERYLSQSSDDEYDRDDDDSDEENEDEEDELEDKDDGEEDDKSSS